jgi:hypothetical protein
MDGDAKPGGPTPDDLDALARYATALADGVEAALPAWVEASVRRVWGGASVRALPADVAAAARAAGQAAVADVVPDLRALLALDVDEQRTNPLSIVRRATRHPTAVLHEAGVAPVDRDAEAVRQFPDDAYDLTPMAFADLDPDLQDLGITWGAAKAHVHLAKRRAEGRR